MSGRALVVDDSSAMRSILRRILQQIGYDVVEARHGIDGLEQLRQAGRLDFALVDWNMPEMNGLEFVVAVRRDTSFRKMPLIMVTTESDMERIRCALDAGADEYIMKPFTSDCIVQKLALLGIGAQ